MPCTCPVCLICLVVLGLVPAVPGSGDIAAPLSYFFYDLRWWWVAVRRSPRLRALIVCSAGPHPHRVVIALGTTRPGDRDGAFRDRDWMGGIAETAALVGRSRRAPHEIHRHFIGLRSAAAWQEACTGQGPESSMHQKVQNGTVLNNESSLCSTCRLSMIVRGRSLDEEIVKCHAMGMRAARVPFKVTFCSSYADARLPSYMEMVEEAWILHPGSKRRRAGFVRGADLRDEELSDIITDLPDSFGE
jgi:hypothetical protein